MTRRGDDRRGGKAEFGRFVEEHLPRLRRYVARMPGARHADVEDLLQDALLRAYEARDRFESDEHAVNWICQAVRNMLVDRRRRWLRRPVLPHADLASGTAYAPDPADLAVVADQADRAVRALSRLTQPQRYLLWEHVVDGVSYADIARRTATPLATVRSLAHRARTAAVREFARAGGALVLLPMWLVRPWRRLSHRIAATPVATDGLSMVGAFFVTIAMPLATATTVAAASHESVVVALDPHLTAAGHPTTGHAAAMTGSLVATRLGATHAARTRVTSAPDPAGAVDSIQTGGFTGTYSDDCTFSESGIAILHNYMCLFSGKSDHCRLKRRGSTTTTTACSLELRNARASGFALGISKSGVEGPAWDCQHGGSGPGTVVFRPAPGARPIRIAVSLFVEETDIAIVSDEPKLLALSASFPFSCALPHQTDQIGLHGTLGA